MTYGYILTFKDSWKLCTDIFGRPFLSPPANGKLWSCMNLMKTYNRNYHASIMKWLKKNKNTKDVNKLVAAKIAEQRTRKNILLKWGYEL